MAFSTGNGGGGPMSEINVTPLVDVMLVLLIIFMITAPLMTHKVKVELPRTTYEKYNPNQTHVVIPITVAVTEKGNVYLNDNLLTKAQLQDKLNFYGNLDPQPPLNIRADRTTRYSLINEVVNAAQAAHMRSVGFVATKEKR